MPGDKDITTIGIKSSMFFYSCSYNYYNIVRFLNNMATSKVTGKVLCELVCMLCFSSLLYKYRITVLFHKLKSSCVSHVKKEQYGSVFIAILYCQYILQLNRLLTVKWLQCLFRKYLLIERKSEVSMSYHIIIIQNIFLKFFFFFS